MVSKQIVESVTERNLGQPVLVDICELVPALSTFPSSWTHSVSLVQNSDTFPLKHTTHTKCIAKNAEDKCWRVGFRLGVGSNVWAHSRVL
jgi:hypothetical protein